MSPPSQLPSGFCSPIKQDVTASVSRVGNTPSSARPNKPKVTLPRNPNTEQLPRSMFSRRLAQTERVACVGWPASARSVFTPLASDSFTATAGRLWLWQGMHPVLPKNPGPAGWRRCRASSMAARTGRGIATLGGAGARRAISNPPALRNARLASVSPSRSAQSSALFPDSSWTLTSAPFANRSWTIVGSAFVAAAIISGVKPPEPLAFGFAPCSRSTRIVGTSASRATRDRTGAVRASWLTTSFGFAPASRSALTKSEFVEAG